MKGKVFQWKDEKAFGFIQPDDGSERLFFHLSSVKAGAGRPQVGDSVIYQATRDPQNRLRAECVIIESGSNAFTSSPRTRYIKIEPPRKNVIDYLAILLGLGALTALGFELYRSSSIESLWLYGVPVVVAMFILNRQKKPKERLFNCARCRQVTEHDSRTIQAWNKGFVKLYCRNCHRQWLENSKRHERSVKNSKSGCLGAMALIFFAPLFGGVGLYQWLV